MDKRLLIVLPLCFAIVLGWNAFAAKLGWIPKPVPRPPISATATNPGAPGASRTNDPTHAADSANPSGAPTSTGEPAKPAIAPVVAESEAREETLVVGRRGQPGYYRAVFSNRGGALKELRTGNYFDRAGLNAEEQQDWKHWTLLVADARTGPNPTHAFDLRTAPSSQDLVRKPLESELWTMKKLAPEAASAPGGVASDGSSSDGVEFTLAPGTGVTFIKRLRFVPGSDQIRFDLEIRNDAKTDAGGARSFLLTPAAGVPNDSDDFAYPEPRAVAFSSAKDGEKANPKVQYIREKGDLLSGSLPVDAPVGFAGVYNKYFALLLRPADETSRASLIGASWRVLHDDDWLARHPDNPDRAFHQIETDLNLQLQVPPVGETRTWSYVGYAGPKQRGALEAALPEYGKIVDDDMGFFGAIAKALLFVLEGFHALTQSWGFSIILLTITVRAILFPINRRSQTAMSRYQAKMKRVQPRIDEIKKKYEKDPARLRQEQGKIMQEEGAFPPLGGCLPPLLQIPVFLGLLSALRYSFDLRQAPFIGWIHDLSLPDHFKEVNWHLPMLGLVQYLNILPPLMVVMWILQQRSMPKPTDEQGQMMYKMMMFMPILTGIWLYNYAAGLSFYMVTQSSLGILEQRVIRKYWPVDDKEPPKKKAGSGFMQKLLEAQEQRQKLVDTKRRSKARR